jgi:FAD/FMN-containing dehydrogenase
MFAADSVGSLAPSAQSPRSLLLGLEGMLPEGLPFRCGARVVKSVAGFDLHKLFVGSRGLLFTATLMHLKLRPKPAAEVGFSTDQLDQPAALRLFSALRQLADPPAALVLQRSQGSFSLHGVLQGTGNRVSENLRRFELSEDDGTLPLHIDVDEHCEVLRGQLRPSRLRDLLAEIPESAPVLVTGGGRFELALDPGRTNIYLGWLGGVQASAEIARGNPARRGRGTALDPNAASIMQGLKLALDPGGVLV